MGIEMSLCPMWMVENDEELSGALKEIVARPLQQVTQSSLIFLHHSDNLIVFQVDSLAL